MSLWKGEGWREEGLVGVWWFSRAREACGRPALAVQHLDGTRSNFGGAVADEREGGEGGREGGRLS